LSRRPNGTNLPCRFEQGALGKTAPGESPIVGVTSPPVSERQSAQCAFSEVDFTLVGHRNGKTADTRGFTSSKTAPEGAV